MLAGVRRVFALIPLNLDGFLFSADYQSGKKAEITSRVAANFVGWEKDPALFDREVVNIRREPLVEMAMAAGWRTGGKGRAGGRGRRRLATAFQKVPAIMSYSGLTDICSAHRAVAAWRT